MATFKIELFGHSNRRHVWHRSKTAFQEKRLVPTVKHDGGNGMVLGVALLPPGLGSLQSLILLWILHHMIERLKIMWGHLSESCSRTRSGTFQWDNDPKCTSNCTKTRLKKKKMWYYGLVRSILYRFKYQMSCSSRSFKRVVKNSSAHRCCRLVGNYTKQKH